MESDSEVKEVREGEGEGELGHMITNDFLNVAPSPSFAVLLNVKLDAHRTAKRFTWESVPSSIDLVDAVHTVSK